MSVENIGQASYTIFKDKDNVYKAKTQSGTIQFFSVDADAVFISVGNALTAGSIPGGKIAVAPGIYPIGDADSDNIGVKIGGTSNGANYAVSIEGAGPDATIFLNTIGISGRLVFSLRANCDISNCTFDGDYLGSGGDVTLIDARQTANFNRIHHNKFRKHTKHALFLANSIISSPNAGFIVEHNMFELPGGGYDQFPSETLSGGRGGIIAHNIFDTNTSGVNYAASVTPGASYNLVIEGNVFRGNAVESGAETIYQGISCEANGNHYNLVIANNTFQHRNIQIGAFWNWSGAGAGWNPQIGNQTYRNVIIAGNVMTDGTIRVQGPNDVPYSGSIKYVSIQHNLIQSARREAIGVRKIADGLTIDNNVIIDSNSRQTASGTEDGWVHPLGLMVVEFTTNARVKDNYLGMTISTNNQDPYGIAYNNNVNLHLQNNRIINSTANPSVLNSGGNVNTILENIYGDATTSGDLSDALSLRKLAQVGVAETLYNFRVEDDPTAVMKIENAVTSSGIFSPRINSTAGGDATITPFQIIGQIQTTNDTGNVPIIIIDGRAVGALTLSGRPLLDVRNNGASLYNFRPASFTVGTSIITSSGKPMGLSGQQVASFESGRMALSGFNWLGTTTSGASAGSGSVLPSGVQTWLQVNVSGVLMKIPAFNV